MSEELTRIDHERKQKLVKYLEGFVTERRLDKFEEVLKERTRHVTVVLEDIYQPHNASAVLRNCDCFGVQDVHIIENRNVFDPNTGITIGADQWLTIHKYREAGANTERCYRQLRSGGYRIVAATPHDENMQLSELSVEEKTALVFGAELDGLSDYAIEQADARVKIPLYGFSESYNLSVSVALCLHEASGRLKRDGASWQLAKEEKLDLRLEWLIQSVRAGEQLVARFLTD